MICISKPGNLGFGGKVNTLMQFLSVSKFPPESKNIYRDFFLGEDCFRAGGFLLQTDGVIQDLLAIEGHTFYPHVKFPLIFVWQREYAAWNSYWRDLITFSWNIMVKKPKKSNWKKAVENPWCNCKHANVSVRRDLSQMFCGEFRGIASSLCNSHLTLGWLEEDHPGHGFSTSACEATHWPLRPGSTLPETLLLGKENFSVQGQREDTALASPVTTSACDGTKFLVLGLGLCFSKWPFNLKE